MDKGFSCGSAIQDRPIIEPKYEDFTIKIKK